MFTLSSFTGGIAQTNSFILQHSSGTLMVDAPEGSAEWLEEQNIRPDALLLTHHHFDHVLDAAAIQAASGCPVYAFSQLSRDLTLENLFGAMAGTQFSVPAFQVDHLLEGQPTVELRGMTWELFHVPGHSLDSLCFYQKELNLLFAGDVLMCEGVGRTDFPGGNTRLLLNGIKTKLLPLPDATMVYSGHGPYTTIGQERQYNPFLT